ncbi:hypothetical protein M0804_014160 [Polistes exclamans]|nr:hypothetical protein M0804_014160 [Polistes exclamans]
METTQEKNALSAAATTGRSEINVCPLTKDNANNKLKYVNCSSPEHPASYGKCPYLVAAQDVKRQSKLIKQVIKNDRINRLVNPQMSYANITKNQSDNFPPLTVTGYPHIAQNLTIYPATKPTYLSAGSFLDYGLLDSRMTVLNAARNKLPTIPYESDHNAIAITFDTISISNGIITPNTNPDRYNYRIANWKKFKQHLQNNYNEQIPYDRNLSIVEINNYIVKLEDSILKVIDAVIPISEQPKNKGCLRYVNHKIKKLHTYKSKLVTALAITDNHNIEQKIRIKTVIKFTNNFLAREFRRSESLY